MDKLYFVKINLLAIDEIIRSYNNQGRKICLSAILCFPAYIQLVDENLL